jgi:hypothetical protein
VLRGVRRGALVVGLVLGALSLGGRPLAAQQRRSPTDDVIEQMKRAVNDLRYDEAIRLGRDLESFAGQLRPAQVVWLRQLLALAWYPEETEAQHPDSALRHLVALVRASPESVLPVEFRWTGLDSLLTAARERTLGLAIAPDAEYVLGGADEAGALRVFTTRAAVVRVSLVHRASGRMVPQDSALVRDRGRVRLRAHDGVAALVEPGEYDLRVVAVDERTRDSVLVTRRASASGAALALQSPPSLDSTRLKPERMAPHRRRTFLTGAAAAVATSLVASAVRGSGSLGETYAPDPRAAGVAGIMLLGAAGIAATEKGREIPEHVRANDAVRSAHANRVAAVRAENARRLAAYRVTLRVAPEDR